MSLFSLFFGAKMKPFEGIPGPKPRLPLGTLGRFLGAMLKGKQSWEVVADMADEYGKLSILWAGPMPILVPNDADLIGEVLVDRPRDFYKLIPVAALMPVVTKINPFVLNGKAWRTARARNPFSAEWFPQWLEDRVPAMMDYAAQRGSKLADAGNVDLMNTIQHFTFDCFSNAVLGQELGDRPFKDFMQMGKVGAFRIQTNLPIMLPPLNPFFYPARSRWHGYFRELIEEARANPNPNAQDLIHTTLREGTELTDSQFALALGNIYFGGAYSAASAIATNLYLVTQNNGALAGIRSELTQHLAQGHSAAALAQCKALESALLESLRLLPPVPLYSRTSIQGSEVAFAGRMIPPKTRIFISNWYLQRMSAHWQDGLTYHPDRWTPEVVEANPIGSGYFFPFGRGERMCMGLPFAMTLLKATLGALWANLDVTVTGDYKQRFFFGVMLPKGLKANFKRR